MTEKKEILVPTGWHEVTIEKFQEIQTIAKDDYYDVELISILCDIDVGDVKRLTLSTYSNILMNLTWISRLPEEASYNPIIKVDGKEYGLVKMSSFTNGEWYSIEKWMEEPIKNLHKFLALIYRPLVTAINDDYRIVEPYNSEDAPIRADIFKKCTVADLCGAFVFFYHIEKECMRTIKDYLQIQAVVMRMPKPVRNWMLKRSITKWKKGNGHGIPFFTQLLKATLERLKKSQDTTSFSPLPIKPLN